MVHQLVFAGHPAEVKADHFVGSQCWLSACPQTDQHAGDDRAVRLNLDSLSVTTEQLAAAQHVLEESEEYLNRPTMRK